MKRTICLLKERTATTNQGNERKRQFSNNKASFTYQNAVSLFPIIKTLSCQIIDHSHFASSTISPLTAKPRMSPVVTS